MDKSDLVESNFQQDLNIINNEIRSLIASLYKFFVSQIDKCDQKIVLDLMSYLIDSVDIILAKIETRRHELNLNITEIPDTDITDIDPSREQRNTNSIHTKSTINDSLNETFDVPPKPDGRTFNASWIPTNRTRTEINKSNRIGQEERNLIKSLTDQMNSLISDATGEHSSQPSCDFHGLFKFND